MKPILDRSFTYRNSANTNIKLLFDRERRRIKESAARKLAEAEAAKAVVLDIEAEVQRKVRGIR
jgi:hypothetical protein